MNYAQQWVHEPQAADLLAIKQSTLRAMRRDGRLEAGTHWIYATGKAGGPVTYNLPAIRQTLAERTVQMVQLEARRRAALRQERQNSIETFNDSGLKLLHAGGEKRMTPRRSRNIPKPLKGPAETLLSVELTREEWWRVLFACVGSPDRNEFDDQMLERIGDQFRYQLRPSLSD